MSYYSSPSILQQCFRDEAFYRYRETSLIALLLVPTSTCSLHRAYKSNHKMHLPGAADVGMYRVLILQVPVHSHFNPRTCTFLFFPGPTTIHRSSTRGAMRAISVFRDAWAMGVAIQVFEYLNDNQSRERSWYNFPQTPRRCQVDTKRCDAPPRCSNIHVYSPTTNSRSSYSFAVQVDRGDRSSTLSPTGFYTYRVTDVRAKLYTELGVSNV